MLQSLQTDISDGKAIQNSFKCIYFCYFLKLIGTRYSSKRTKGKKKKKKKEGKEEEEITPVYREVLWAVFDGAAVSLQQEQDHHQNHHHHHHHHHHQHHPGFVWAHHRGDDEEDSSCGIKGSPHSPPAAMGFCEGFADRVAQMSCFITFRIPYIYDIQ
jgi:hypothetical protein